MSPQDTHVSAVVEAPAPRRRWVGAIGGRNALLIGLIILLIILMFAIKTVNVNVETFSTEYLASSLINYIPVALLAIAELFVIATGRGAIDLSVGAMVSLSGMIFGVLYQSLGVPLWLAITVAIAFSGVLGLLNGVLTAYLRFPALIATLATFYAYESISLVMTNGQPISGQRIAGLFSAIAPQPLPLVGGFIPPIPIGLFTFLLPVAVITWFLLNRSTYGHSLYAIGTNWTAAQWVGLKVRAIQLAAFVFAGLISGVAAVYTVAQFASARADAGTSGSGLALPAITIAVLGGVAITGGTGRLSGVLLAALLIQWLDSSLLLLVPGNMGVQLQYLALGVVLLIAAVADSSVRTQLRHWMRSITHKTKAPIHET